MAEPKADHTLSGNTTDNNGTAAPEVVSDKKAENELGTFETKETVSSLDDSEPVGTGPEAYYRNFTPIAELNLPDWRHTEKQLVNRLDWTLMPTLWLLYMNNYLDRTNIAQARLNTLDEDLGLTGADFSTAVSVLTVGYMLAQVPSNMLLTRVRPSMYIPATAIVWSAVSAATAGATNSSTLITIRFFLGILEAPMFPGSLYIMSCWYTRKELALRTSILYSGLLVAQCISGLLAAGIFAGMDGTAGLAGWQWLFIIEALMSTVCGIAAFFTLPDYPHSKTGSQRWSMDEDMRRLGEARIVADRVTGSTGSGGVFAGLKLALKDFKTYIFMWMNLVMTAGYGFNFFFPTLISGLNIGNNITALLLTSPPYLLGAVLAMTIAWNSDRLRERGYHMLGALTAAIVGYIITLSTTNIAARYAATFFYCPGAFAANALVYSWAMSTLATTPEKKASGGAAVNVIGHIGNVVSPYFFLERERPTYRIAFIIMLVFIALSIATVFSTKVYLKIVNKKLRKQADETGETFNPFNT